jgi:hypothetical protein
MKVADRIENAYLAILRYTFLFVATVSLIVVFLFSGLALQRLLASPRAAAAAIRPPTIQEFIASQKPHSAAQSGTQSSASSGASDSSTTAFERSSAEHVCENLQFTGAIAAANLSSDDLKQNGLTGNVPEATIKRIASANPITLTIDDKKMQCIPGEIAAAQDNFSSPEDLRSYWGGLVPLSDDLRRSAIDPKLRQQLGLTSATVDATESRLLDWSRDRVRSEIAARKDAETRAASEYAVGKARALIELYVPLGHLGFLWWSC